MHSPGYRVTLILKNAANAKTSGYHPDGKKSSHAKFSFLLEVEQIGSKQNVILSHFLYKMYGKHLKMVDLSYLERYINCNE